MPNLIIFLIKDNVWLERIISEELVKINIGQTSTSNIAIGIIDGMQLDVIFVARNNTEHLVGKPLELIVVGKRNVGVGGNLLGINI